MTTLTTEQKVNLQGLLAEAHSDENARHALADALLELGREEMANTLRKAWSYEVAGDLIREVWEDAVPHAVLPVVAPAKVWRLAGWDVVMANGRLEAVPANRGMIDKALLISWSRGREGMGAIGAALEIVNSLRE